MDIIILAAGNSSRFGSNKLFHEINGKYMYQYILEHACQLKANNYVEHIIFVTQYEELNRVVSEQYPEVNIVKNLYPEKGISYSVGLGIDRLFKLNSESESCLFAVSDQPYLRYETLVNFIEEYKIQNQFIGICANESRMGNPVIFSEKYYPELGLMSGDKGGKQVVMKHLEDTFLFQVAEKELEDIDVRISGINK